MRARAAPPGEADARNVSWGDGSTPRDRVRVRRQRYACRTIAARTEFHRPRRPSARRDSSAGRTWPRRRTSSASNGCGHRSGRLAAACRRPPSELLRRSAYSGFAAAPPSAPGDCAVPDRQRERADDDAEQELPHPLATPVARLFQAAARAAVTGGTVARSRSSSPSRNWRAARARPAHRATGSARRRHLARDTSSRTRPIVCPSSRPGRVFMSSALGASTGNQTSYQSSREKSALGTPRGGRRTVPRRVPSPAARAVPRRTMRMLIGASP